MLKTVVPAPLRRIIKKTLWPSHYRWDGIEAAFIVSTGRTGTQFLAQFFDRAFDRVLGIHEPCDHAFDIAAHQLWGDISGDEALRRFWREREEVCRDVHLRGADYYVESNQYLAYAIPMVERAFPGFRLVHVVRDGRDVVRSGMDHRVPNPPGGTERVPIMSPEDPLRRVQATDFPDDPYRERWAEMSRFERMCWFWAKKDKSICDAIADRETAITVRFEDIFDRERDYEGMWKVITFLGLEDRLRVPLKTFGDMMSTRANLNRDRLFPRWPEWTAEQQAQFEEIAGAHNRRHGYDEYPAR